MVMHENNLSLNGYIPVCAEQDDHIGSGFGLESENPITARDYSDSLG